MKPNFFIPGGPKCGTTSLAAWLAEHPDVFITDPKEPCYFSHDYRHLTPVNTLEDYQKLYQRAKGHKAIGEATPFYLASGCASNNILEYAPEAKFIVCLRNPVNMAQSMHAHWFRAGYESVRDFETAWKLIEERRAGRSVPLSCPDGKMLDYANVSSLGAQVDRLLEQVPKERILFVPLEDWRDPRTTWLKVQDFLGVADDGRTDFPVKNQGRRVRWPFVSRLMSSASTLRYKLGMKRGFGLQNLFLKLNEKPGKAPPLSPEFSARLHQHFADDVRLLAQLTGRDLQHWLHTE